MKSQRDSEAKRLKLGEEQFEFERVVIPDNYFRNRLAHGRESKLLLWMSANLIWKNNSMIQKNSSGV